MALKERLAGIYQNTLPRWVQLFVAPGLCAGILSVELAFWLKLDRLRIMAGQNWLALHNTPTVSAHQKWADRVFRFEYGEHFLAVQRIRSSDASAYVSVILAIMDLVIAPLRYRPAGLLFNELLEGLVAFFSNFGFLYG
jgi:hypothetical protein